jgi:hypothetical protein
MLARRALRRTRSSQAGQAIVMVAFAMTVLLTGIGLAIDASQGYYYSATAERAAAAGALSGVIFMPNQFTSASAIPPGSGNDATDRAKAEGVRNGHGIVAANVVATQVAGQTNQLQVQVTVTVSTLFMRMFGFNTYPVSRTAIAEYLAPITLGQPGSQAGSTVSQLGTGGNNFYFMREEGWSSDRGQGDAFTPNPATEYGGALVPPALDVHQISGGNDVTDPNLPARGGYNYLVNLPAGGYLQVYNAAFAPDGNGGAHNYCENSRVAWFLGPIGPCSLLASSYYLHEEDSVVFATDATYAAMEYTLFKVNNNFIHSTDTELAQMKVLPIDASNWAAASKQYLNVNTNATITQSYNFNGTPSNMLIYHNWVDVTNYAGAADGGLVKRTLTYGTTQLPAGTYRLRVDTLNFDGTMPPGGELSHKAYAVRALDTAGNACAACTVGAWSEMAYYTPIAPPAGGAFAIPIFQLPPAYAGRTISVDVYDAGDAFGPGNVDISILDPSGAVVKPTAPATVGVYNLGVDRASNPASAGNLLANSATASYRAASAGSSLYNGRWIEMQVPIPSTYNPGVNPANWTFSLQYQVGPGVTATDTVTVAVGLLGAPAHLLVS